MCQCLIDVIKMYGGIKVQLRVFLTPALYGGVWSTARPKERAVGTRESVFNLAPLGNRTPTVSHVQYPNPCTELFRCTTAVLLLLLPSPVIAVDDNEFGQLQNLLPHTLIILIYSCY